MPSPKNRRRRGKKTNLGKKKEEESDAGEETILSTFDVDAILLAADEEMPRPIKLQVRTMSGSRYDSDPWQKVETEPWLRRSENTFVRMYVVDKAQWTFTGPPFDTLRLKDRIGKNILAIFFDDNFMVNGSKTNQCIRRLTNGEAFHPWGGNILAIRVEASRMEAYSDVSFEEDVALLKTYFSFYGRTDWSKVKYQSSPRRILGFNAAKTVGVVIASLVLLYYFGLLKLMY